jgi:aldose 1-epimerase
MKTLRSIFVLLLLAAAARGGDFVARESSLENVGVVVLTDNVRSIEVTIVPGIGNMARSMMVRGRDVLWSPPGGLAAFKAKPSLAGIPFLAPWANRIDQLAFFANGKKYLLNEQLGNLKLDRSRQPIHGLLATSPHWQVVAVSATATAAEVTSRFEFWRHPELMAQFPFAHTIEMTYRLKAGELQVETVLKNHSTAPMPVLVGFHPYLRVHDAPRDQWQLHLAAREHVVLSEHLVPTGATKPVAFADPLPLAGVQFDDVFSGLIRNEAGRAEFWFQGAKQRISVELGPQYRAGVIFAPKGRDFVCIEPMAAITNGINLAHAGSYQELQSVPAGGEWRESFWIRAAGF